MIGRKKSTPQQDVVKMLNTRETRPSRQPERKVAPCWQPSGLTTYISDAQKSVPDLFSCPSITPSPIVEDVGLPSIWVEPSQCLDAAENFNTLNPQHQPQNLSKLIT